MWSAGPKKRWQAGKPSLGAWRNALRARAEAGDATLARFRSKPRVSAGLLGPVRIRVER
jgi:hypothetical protein